MTSMQPSVTRQRYADLLAALRRVIRHGMSDGMTDGDSEAWVLALRELCDAVLCARRVIEHADQARPR